MLPIVTSALAIPPIQALFIGLSPFESPLSTLINEFIAWSSPADPTFSFMVVSSAFFQIVLAAPLACGDYVVANPPGLPAR